MAYSGTGEDLKASNYGYVYESRAIKYNTPFNLFDGDRSTLWQSYSDLYEEYTDETEINIIHIRLIICIIMRRLPIFLILSSYSPVKVGV